MNYSYVEIEYVATIFSPIRTDLALKLLMPVPVVDRAHTGTEPKYGIGPLLVHLLEPPSI